MIHLKLKKRRLHLKGQISYTGTDSWGKGSASATPTQETQSK